MKCLILLFLAFVLWSCGKDHYTAPVTVESKLLGIWIFEDAYSVSTTSSAQSSIYSDYERDQLKFNEDGSLLYTEDFGSGAARNGTWTVDQREIVYQDIEGFDSIEVINTLNLSIGESNNKEEEHHWEIDFFENETLLKGREFKKNRTYGYSLRKKY